MESSGADIPGRTLARLLGDIAAELGDIAVLASNLQARLVPCEHSPGELQHLDLITQRITGAAGFAAELARIVPTHWACDPARALARLALSAQAHHFAGTAAYQPARADASIVDLF